jgi:hypothetical protein
MAVSRKPAAVPAKKTAARSAAANRRTTAVNEEVVGSTTDLVYVRHQALSYARSLFPSPNPGEKLSPAQLVTAASKLESYMLNGRGASNEEDD